MSSILDSTQKILKKITAVCFVISLGIIIALETGETAGFDLISYSRIPDIFYSFPIIKLLKMLIIGALFYAIFKALDTKYIERMINGSDRRLAVVLLLLAIPVIIFGLWWIWANQCQPKWDSYDLILTASEIANGEQLTDHIYFYMNPNQRGIVMILSLIYRMFPDNPTHVIYVINVIFIVLTIFITGLIVYRMTESASAAMIAVIMLDSFVPLTLYAVFIYGTVPSLFFTMAGFYFALRFSKRDSALNLIFMSLSLFLAMFIYSGIVIADLAVIVYLLLSCKKTTGIKSLAGVVLITLGMISATKLGTLWYVGATGLDVGAGKSGISYIYMGITAGDGMSGAGGVNGIHDTLARKYADSDENYLGYILNDTLTVVGEYLTGKRDLLFFYEKLKCQWTNSMFSSLTFTQSINAISHGLTAEYLSFLRGNFFRTILSYMESFTYMIYSAAFFIGVSRLMFNRKAETLLFEIFFVGGFLFEVLWEQDPRYSLPYFYVLIVMTAIGVSYTKGIRNINTNKL